MKQLYLVGTHISFEYSIYNFFNKIKKVNEEWVQRNAKYIYASTEDEAIKKYMKWFYHEYKKIINGWGDWYNTSENVHCYMSDNNCTITKQYPVILKEEKDFQDLNINLLKKHMMYSDFKEWWTSENNANVLTFL